MYAWGSYVAGIYFFPNLLPAVTFTAYIGTGHSIDLQTAAATLVIFGMMTESLINVPFFFTEVINLIVSLNRISGFLDLDQVQECIVERNPTADEGQNAIEVKGNFSWGFSANKKKKTEDDEGSDEEEKKAIEVQPEEKENEEVPTLGKYMTL